MTKKYFVNIFPRTLTTLLLLFTPGELLSDSEVLVYGKIETLESQGITGVLITFVSQADGKTDSTYSDENGEYSIYLNIGETGIDDEKQMPVEFKLYQNYPNPFNPGTWIPFELPKPAKVKITIYNILGQKINTVADEYYPKGKSEVYWTGIDEKGKSVSAGVYFYQLEAAGKVKAGKMLLMDEGCGVKTGNISRFSQKHLLKTSNTLIRENFTIRAEKAGFFDFVENGFVVTSEDTAIEKNMLLSQYALCYNNIIDWGEPYTLDWEILITDINGDSVKNISNHPEEDDYNPTWSPDGRYIAFRRDKPVGGCDIYLYDIFSDSLINLTTDLADNESASSPEWTPDGEKIAYTQRNNGINYQYIMNKDGSDKRKLNDWINFFYNDSYHFICSKGNNLYKTDIDGISNEFLVDLNTLGEHNVWIDDFNPDEEIILCHEDSAEWTFCYSFLIKTYNFRTSKIDTLAVADSGWIFIRPKYSNDYSNITFVERNYNESISNMVIFENSIKKNIVTLTDEDEWFDYSPIVFSPNDNYLAYSKNINQEGDWFWWKSYLHVVNINTKEIKFIDGEKAVDPQWNPLLPY